MRGKLSVMMSGLDGREGGLCYYCAGDAPRPGRPAKAAACVVIPLRCRSHGEQVIIHDVKTVMTESKWSIISGVY